jgi:acyl-CoA thioesterase FadM
MRIKIKFHSEAIFSAKVKVRISDINYGGHVGNDSILSIMHEARLSMLKQWHFTEMNVGGCGLIMADSAVQYKAESFYGDEIEVFIYVENLSSVSFDLLYKLSTIRDQKNLDIAYAKTGMIAFDYSERKVVAIPETLASNLRNTTR